MSESSRRLLHTYPAACCYNVRTEQQARPGCAVELQAKDGSRVVSWSELELGSVHATHLAACSDITLAAAVERCRRLEAPGPACAPAPAIALKSEVDVNCKKHMTFETYVAPLWIEDETTTLRPKQPLAREPPNGSVGEMHTTPMQRNTREKRNRQQKATNKQTN